jgi:hypothetical protein
MKKVTHSRRASWAARRACRMAALIAAAGIIAAPASAGPKKPYASPYTRAAVAQHARAAHASSGNAPTAMQAAGRPRTHAPAKR